MINKDLVIIGGGSAGLAAAISAYDEGIKDLLIIEKDHQLGGILNQCIHNGFGLTEFKEELTGPEYALRFIDQAKERNIPYVLDSFVINVTKDKVVRYSNSKDGVVEIKAKAIVLASGCYERNAGSIGVGGKRLSGVMTAGMAQKYINIKGYAVGKRVVILGSGDIGLIMARRMTLEGAKVELVAELMPYSNGLNRNIAQCLNDYDIPLYLSTTIKEVKGKDRVESVVLASVDSNRNFIPGTEREVKCDTLILSVGLVPNVGVVKDMGLEISSTKGPKVNSLLEGNIEGVFACGNCLHVHDLVDFVTDEGRNAGLNAAKYIKGLIKHDGEIALLNKDNVSYVVPSKIVTPIEDDVKIKFRVRSPMKNVEILIQDDEGVVLKKMVKVAIIPSEMENIKLRKDDLLKIQGKNVYVSVRER